MSAADVAKSLGDLRDGARQSAIATFARNAQIRVPLSGADGAAILLGASHSPRANAIAELAPLFKADLSGQEAAAILGPEDVLTDGNRQYAIAALARAKRFGPSIGEDAALALKGASHSSRATAIAELAPYLRVGMSGGAIAAVLGPATVLTDGNRQSAIAAIARSTKQVAVLSGADGAAILLGASHSPRANAIAELAPLFKADLSGQEAAAILGAEDVLTDGNRQYAIAALARAKRFGPSIGEDAALALKGASHSSRAAAIAELAPYLRAGMSGAGIAKVLGSAAVLSEGNRNYAIAALVNAGKVPSGLTSDELTPVLEGTTGQTRIAAIALLGAGPARVASGASQTLPRTGATPVFDAGAPIHPQDVRVAGSTPAIASAPVATGVFGCSGLFEFELQFCNLLIDTAQRVASGVIDKTIEIGVRKGMLALFRRLTPSMQRELFNGRFLGIKLFSASYKKTIDKVIANPNPLSYFDVNAIDLFSDAVKMCVDAYIEEALLGGDPWKFAAAQFLSDQIYVGVHVALSHPGVPVPQAKILEAVLVETQITVQRMVTVVEWSFLLRAERRQAVASWAATMGKTAAITVLQQNALSPPASQARGFTVNNAAAAVRTSVTGTDIPRFSEVAALVLDAQIERLRAGGLSSAAVLSKVAAAVSLAKRFDSERPWVDRIYVTAFGSYEGTTSTLMGMLGFT